MRREIKQIFHGQQVLEGAGVRLRRVFGFPETSLFDPFLLFDDFCSDSPADFLKGFPWHPHRGIETITYVIRGDVEHRDSLGNTGVISSGDVQWMTAGNGILHQEMPKGDSNGSMHGFQLWANLPASHKMMTPRYRDITAADIPEVILDNGTVIKVIAGTVHGISGPTDNVVIDPEYLDCTVPANTEFKHPTQTGYTSFLYVIAGEGSINDTPVQDKTLVLFEDGDKISICASKLPLRFLHMSGKPLHQPIAWRGPIVMNTAEELAQAFRELQNDTFIQHSPNSRK
jgi:redox-sensitive bicupin YhaK (pirin superfamily)